MVHNITLQEARLPSAPLSMTAGALFLHLNLKARLYRYATVSTHEVAVRTEYPKNGECVATETPPANSSHVVGAVEFRSSF